MRDNLIGKLKMIDHEQFSDNKKDGNGREFKTSALVSLHSVSNIGYSYEWELAYICIRYHNWAVWECRTCHLLTPDIEVHGFRLW